MSKLSVFIVLHRVAVCRVCSAVSTVKYQGFIAVPPFGTINNSYLNCVSIKISYSSILLNLVPKLIQYGSRIKHADGLHAPLKGFGYLS
jgi:hypothetical protein